MSGSVYLWTVQFNPLKSSRITTQCLASIVATADDIGSYK